MPLLTRKLSKRYGDTWVLRDVSLEVGDGEILGLFGASDSGKSTLLRILAGRETATTGTFDAERCFLAGRNNWPIFSFIFSRVDADHDARFAAFNDSLTAKERLILLDEPFAGFDASSRFQSIDRFRRHVKNSSRTAIVASNDFETISLISDKIAILADGEIKQSGKAQEIYDNPNSVEVALLTGRNNIFYARRLTSSKVELPEFQTVDGNHRLFARKVDAGQLGAINRNVALAIRPQDVSISFGASFPEDNLLKAVVTGVRHQGPTTMIEFDAQGLALEALVFRLVGLDIADECMLGLPPDRIKVLRD